MRIALALAAALAVGGALAQPHPPTIPPQPPCSPVPKNWKLGTAPLPFEEADKRLTGSRGWEVYKKGRHGLDQYREFRDGKTQGILATRRGCLHSFFITK
jgi:hypothetical protein